ncbi:MAG: hypothetical protein R3C20_17865 [Planctomycetaceae bacterium]
MSYCYLMGGPSLTKDVLRLYLFLLVVCLQLTVIGMLVGTWCRSTSLRLRWRLWCDIRTTGGHRVSGLLSAWR